MVIYQVFTRLFGNDNAQPRHNGTKAENGCGTMAHFTTKALEEIRGLGCTHVWYTGVIEHATQTDYSAHGIAPDHPAVVKGRAGSPYAIKDYYDVDPDLARDVPARMREWENLIRRTHKAGLGVVMDFVPNHVARQYHSDACPEGVSDLGADDDTSLRFSPQNNFYYLGEPLHLDGIPAVAASPSVTSDSSVSVTPSVPVGSADGPPYVESPARATGNDQFTAWPSQNDWYETIKLNYGIDVEGGRVGHFHPVPSTWHKMLNILLFWAARGVDAFRCDMAEMVPVEFWEWVIPQVKAQHPGLLFIAEVYNPAEYRSYIHRGHFDYLYDKVGLYDTLKAVVRGEASTHSITPCWQQVDDIRQHMLNFLENHDEQRLASDFFAGDALKGRAPLLVSALMYTNPMMVYFGQELGERGMDEEGFSGLDGRTTIFDYWTVDTIRRWRNRGRFDGQLLTDGEKALRAFYQQVLTLKEQHPALSHGACHDLMYANGHLHRQYAFVRSAGQDTLLVVANFAEADCAVTLNLPQGMFTHLGLQPCASVVGEDLLTGTRQQFPFTPECPMQVHIPAWGGVVLQVRADFP